MLSLLALLVLVVSPLCRCAMAEASPGHSHSAAAGSTVAGHAHEATPDAHHKDGTAHHKDDQRSLSSVPESHVCCCDSNVPPVVLATLSHSAAPDASSWMPAFTPATLPAMQDIFALTNCYGRDGPPPDEPLRSQFFPSSLLGRAPPVSV